MMPFIQRTTRTNAGTRRWRLLTLTLVLSVMTASAVQAHGGVSIEDDKCIMTIGTYRAHFSGYQPKVRASREFCEDIPVVADAIIVLDFISQALREMEVDFRVVRDVKGIGVTAAYDDLGSPAEIDAATLVYRSPARYPNGNFDISLKFEQAGDFIGVLTARDVQSDREYIAVFPFSVGKTDWVSPLRWGGFVLLVVALIYWLAPKGGTPPQQTA